LAKSTVAPTPYLRVLSTVYASISESVNPRSTNSERALMWNRGGGPGYGLWSIYNPCLGIRMDWWFPYATHPFNPVGEKPVEALDEEEEAEHDAELNVEIISEDRES
jgi:hypothetical protein